MSQNESLPVSPAAARLRLNFHVEQQGNALWFELSNESSLQSLFCNSGARAGAYVMQSGQNLNVQAVANSNGSSAEYQVELVSAELRAKLLRGTPPSAFPFTTSVLTDAGENSVTPIVFSGKMFLTSNEDGAVQFLSSQPLVTTVPSAECAYEVSVVLAVKIGGREVIFTLDPEVIVEQPR